MSFQNKSQHTCVSSLPESLPLPRFNLELDLTVESPKLGPIPGHAVEIGGSSISAVLKGELNVGEKTAMCLNLPFGPVNIHAVVRDRRDFRHDFEFINFQWPEDVLKKGSRDAVGYFRLLLILAYTAGYTAGMGQAARAQA